MDEEEKEEECKDSKGSVAAAVSVECCGGEHQKEEGPDLSARPPLLSYAFAVALSGTHMRKQSVDVQEM
eukprot:709526-Rhodomonas_salina.1